MADQSITIVGNVGGDPELKYTPGGTGLASFSVGVSNRYQRKGSTDWEEETTWMRVTAWGTLGENVAASVRKGHRVVVTGRIKTRSWDKPDGTKGYAWDVHADEVAPSLRWATAQVESTQRFEGRQANEDEYLPPEEPF